MANYSVLTATKSFFVKTSEGVVKVVKGDLVRAGHEITKDREDLFQALKVKFDYDVKAAEVEASKAVAAEAPKVAAEAAKAAPEVTKAADAGVKEA